MARSSPRPTKFFLRNMEFKMFLIGTFNKQGMIQKEYVPVRKTVNI